MIRFSRADHPSPLPHSAGGGVKDIHNLTAPGLHAVNCDAEPISINYG
jgi:hypothetical protein